MQLVGVLVPVPGIVPRSLAVKVPNPNHWTARELPYPPLCIFDA